MASRDLSTRSRGTETVSGLGSRSRDLNARSGDLYNRTRDLHLRSRATGSRLREAAQVCPLQWRPRVGVLATMAEGSADGNIGGEGVLITCAGGAAGAKRRGGGA
eukprot:3940429-Rhodomonas_salina.4